MLKNLALICLFLTLRGPWLAAQEKGHVKGHIRDTDGFPVPGAHVTMGKMKTITNTIGDFFFTAKGNQTYQINATHVIYDDLSEELYLPANDTLHLTLVMKESIWILEDVNVVASDEGDKPLAPGVTKLRAEDIESVPSTDDDIGQIVSLLPGVVGGIGLSNMYSVRGGSFEENLVYIEDIPIYKPYLISSGQQEGLGTINRGFLKSLTFSAGGWPSKYGNKLSSVLNADYRYPKRNGGQGQLSLLGGNAQVEGTNKKGTWRMITGTRYKNTRLLLNNNPISGQYQPNFVDIQTLIRYEPIRQEQHHPKHEYMMFGSYARNRYLFFPQTQKTRFGTFSRPISFIADFDGQFVLGHDIYQTGFKTQHYFSDNMRLGFITSNALSLEKEYLDLKNEYRLCDIVVDPNNSSIEICEAEIGTGKNYTHERNTLTGTSSFNEAQWGLFLDARNYLEVALHLDYDRVNAGIVEYQYADSADYITISHNIQHQHKLSRHLIGGYFQNTIYYPDSLKWLTGGIRWGYSKLNEQTWLSPRLHFALKPHKGSRTNYKFSVGLYHQPPFYREMRGVSGQLNKRLRAQNSLHMLLGTDHSFFSWGREFKLFVEGYYKYLTNLVPYEQREALLQYYALNMAQGYAYGVDLRLHGAFVPNEESWFSVSYLNTAEDLENDDRGYIRRPTDQRLTLGFFFQDYIPYLPSWGVYFKNLYGTGLPVSPIGQIHYRNVFNPPEYYRLDMGFSKEITFNEQKKNYIKKIVFTLEALNLLGTSQVLYHSWVRTHNNEQFAVPNVYNVRFVNFKINTNF